MDHRPAPIMAPPADPLAAVTHPDPYPYYRTLAERGPVWFDPQLRLWVVTGYDAIVDVLHNPAARTRPVAEPIPAALRGTATGDVFGQLVRMTDSAQSRAVKGALHRAMTDIPPERARALAGRVADEVLTHAAGTGEPDWPGPALFAIPITVVAKLLGFPEPALAGLPLMVRQFAAALAPAPFTGSVADGDRATTALLAEVGELVERAVGRDTGLLGSFIRLARPVGPDWRALVVANAIGLLFQSLDATAGLIGNGLRALGTHPDFPERVAADPARLSGIVRETLRHDPPVHNTRRFLAEPGSIAGQEVEPGGTLLLVIAAANRDPAIFADPDRFNPDRVGPEPLSFGIGAHRCPGQRLAWEIAVAGILSGIRHGLADAAQTPLRFMPSPNARVPLLPPPRTCRASVSDPH